MAQGFFGHAPKSAHGRPGPLQITYSDSANLFQLFVQQQQQITTLMTTVAQQQQHIQQMWAQLNMHWGGHHGDLPQKEFAFPPPLPPAMSTEDQDYEAPAEEEEEGFCADPLVAISPCEEKPNQDEDPSLLISVKGLHQVRVGQLQDRAHLLYEYFSQHGKVRFAITNDYISTVYDFSRPPSRRRRRSAYGVLAMGSFQEVQKILQKSCYLQDGRPLFVRPYQEHPGCPLTVWRTTFPEQEHRGAPRGSRAPVKEEEEEAEEAPAGGFLPGIAGYGEQDPAAPWYLPPKWNSSPGGGLSIA